MNETYQYDLTQRDKDTWRLVIYVCEGDIRSVLDIKEGGRDLILRNMLRHIDSNLRMSVRRPK